MKKKATVIIITSKRVNKPIIKKAPAVKGGSNKNFLHFYWEKCKKEDENKEHKRSFRQVSKTCKNMPEKEKEELRKLFKREREEEKQKGTTQRTSELQSENRPKKRTKNTDDN